MPQHVPSNPGYSAATAIRLPVERAWLYQPETEWFYSHHPHLTFFNGRHFAIWSNGRQDEDAPGQRVLFSTSADFRAWTPPVPLLDAQPGRHSERVLTAAGFHQHAGRLVAYIGSYEYRPDVLENGRRRPGDQGHMDTTLLAMTTPDGVHWDGPVDLRVPIIPNHGPQATASGRLIISGNISFPYTDDPSGLSGWRMTGLYPATMAANIVDDSESFWQVKAAMGWPVGLCEGSFYQTDDGVLLMLLRSNGERLWVTESRDDGATWSEPLPTAFSDNATKFHFGRLPDGRFYYVGCPDPEPRWRRSPLVLSLSEDGLRFDRHFVLADSPYVQHAEGLHKGGEYGYPHTWIQDGTLHVIVSRKKEAVEVLQVPLDALPARRHTPLRVDEEILWAPDHPRPAYRDLRFLATVEHRRIHACDEAYRFLLGVSLAWHQGTFFAAWGTSAKDENDAESVCAYKTSPDAVCWSEWKAVTPSLPGLDAHSHGVLLSARGALWAFVPRAHFADMGEFPNLRMEVLQFNEAAQVWDTRGETAPGFWPLCEPVKMDDGNWILGGAVPHRSPRCDAAVAISQGDDLTRWDVVTLPGAAVTWGETTVAVDGPQVRAFIRPCADGRPLLTALSRDFGRSWSRQRNSDLPVSAAKPYAGRLSTGQTYLLANVPVPGLEPRDTLVIFLSRPGASCFADVRIVRQGKSSAPRSSGGGIGPQWAYPCAIEHDGKLYVGYAATKENAELSVVDVVELSQDLHALR
jgi:hypothetical protein